MNKLTEILRSILFEAKEKLHKGSKEGPIRDTVKEAIKNSIENHWPIYIEYEGDEENEPGKRWLEPYVWGLRIHTDNNILRAYQYRGQSVSKDSRGTAWRTFRLDRISNTAPLTGATFSRPRPKYNPDGDKQMTKIFIQAKFGGEDNATGPEAEPKGPNGPIDIQSPEIQKTAELIEKNTHDDKVDFNQLERAPEFRNDKMKKALNVIKRMISRVGKGIIRGLQQLHLKEDIDEIY